MPTANSPVNRTADCLLSRAPLGVKPAVRGAWCARRINHRGHRVHRGESQRERTFLNAGAAEERCGKTSSSASSALPYELRVHKNCFRSSCVSSVLSVTSVVNPAIQTQLKGSMTRKPPRNKKPSDNLERLSDGVFSRRGQIAEASCWFLRPTAFDD